MSSIKNSKWVKICSNPQKNLNCLVKQYYSNKYDLKYALKKDKLCKSCVFIGREILWCDKLSISKSGDKNPQYGKRGKKSINYGRKLTKEHRQKIGYKNKGRIKSENEIKNLSKATKKSFENPERRKQNRISAIRRIEKAGGKFIPNYNPDACKIINWFNMFYDFKFQHAENGGEICVGGYFPDGFDKTVIIEIDEKHHYDSDGNLKQKDIERQQYLENKGYEFIRVKVGKFPIRMPII